MHPSRRSAANLNHSFLAATWVIATVRRGTLMEQLVADPKFNLYSSATCNSDRPEISAVNGQRVSIVSRCQLDNGMWQYSVTPERKAATIFECIETELDPAEPRNNFADARSFAIIRQMLGCYLHQDFDAEFDSIADAILSAIKHTDVDKLVNALTELDTQPDAIVEEVLHDHSVYLWDMTTPREFLTMLKTLASLT